MTFTNFSAERAIIGNLLKGTPGAVDEILGELKPSDFADTQAGVLFALIRTTKDSGKAVDLVTVGEQAAKEYPDQAGMMALALADAYTETVTAVNYKSYLGIVKDLSKRRKAIAKVTNILVDLQDPENETGAVLDAMRQASIDLDQGKAEWDEMSDVLKATIEHLEKRSKGLIPCIGTGIPNVDSLIGGFFGGEMTVLAARPSVGKSAFAMEIALAAAKKGFKVGICSREMTSIQFGQRLIQSGAPIDGMKLRQAKLDIGDWEKIIQASGEMANLPVSFLFSVKNVEDLRRETQKRRLKGDLDMLIIDYLQLMGTTSSTKEEHLRVGHISRTLKGMAVDFNIPVIALAQVNRAADGQMPTLSMLKASGDIEQDADGVIFLHRPTDASDRFVDPRDKQYFSQYAKYDLEYIAISVAKQRQGRTGQAAVLFDKKFMTYRAIDRTGQKVYSGVPGKSGLTEGYLL